MPRTDVFLLYSKLIYMERNVFISTNALDNPLIILLIRNNNTVTIAALQRRCICVPLRLNFENGDKEYCNYCTR